MTCQFCDGCACQAPEPPVGVDPSRLIELSPSLARRLLAGPQE